MPFASGATEEAAYNTVDLGDPETPVDVLRPVEFEAESASPAGGGTHASSPSRAEVPAPTVNTSGPSVEASRETTVSPSYPAQNAGPTTAEETLPPPVPQPAAPKKDPNFKASLAGGVLAPQASTRVASQHRTEPKTEGTPHARPWIKILGYVGVTVVVVVAIAFLVGHKPATGTITGVVVDAQSGRVIPSATVELDGKVTAATNAAGLYVFTNVRAGSYMVKASAPGYQPQVGSAQSNAPQSAQLSFALAPLAATSSTPPASATPADTEGTQTTASTTPSPSYGGVDLDVDFDNFLIFVDGEIYGKNAKKLKRLPTGEHRLVLQMEGFQDYTTTVTVKARVTATVTIAKSDLTPKVDPIKRSHGLFAEGKGYLDRSQWLPAIEAFDQALASDAQNVDAVRYRGWAHMKAGDTANATADFNRAAQMYDDSRRLMDAVTCVGYLIDLTPRDPALWRQRGDYYLGLTEYSKAISDCEQALKLDKKSVENQMALAEAYFASGDFQRAAKEFDRARKMSGDPIKPYIRMILAYYHAGNNDEVIKKYRDFAKIAPLDLQKKLQADPEWLPVLQIIGPDERNKN
jgi:Tfp pilus assembly protein PilF